MRAGSASHADSGRGQARDGALEGQGDARGAGMGQRQMKAPMARAPSMPLPVHGGIDGLPPNHPQSRPVQALLEPGSGLVPFGLAQMLTHGHPHGPYGKWAESELEASIPEDDEFGGGEGSDDDDSDDGGAKKRGGGRGGSSAKPASSSSSNDQKERKRLRKREARKRMAKRRREREVEAERLRLEVRLLRSHRFGARVVSASVQRAVGRLQAEGKVADDVTDAAAVDGPLYLPGPRGIPLRRLVDAAHKGRRAKGARPGAGAGDGLGAGRRGGRRMVGGSSELSGGESGVANSPLSPSGFGGDGRSRAAGAGGGGVHRAAWGRS